MNLEKLCFCILAFLLPLCSWGQTENKKVKWSVQANLAHQDIMVLDEISIGQLGVAHQVRVRPYYTLDIQRSFYRKPQNKFFFVGQLGYFADLYHDHWLSFNMGIGYERQVFRGLFAALRFKVGIARLKSHDVQYAYEAGRWVKTSNNSSALTHPLGMARIDLGYRLRKGDHPIDLVSHVQSTIIAHRDFGAIPYGALGLGLRYGL